MEIIIIIIILFIGYRMNKFKNSSNWRNIKENNVTVHEHLLEKKGSDCNGKLRISYCENPPNIKYSSYSNLYSFTLLYKSYFIIGEYIFHQELKSIDLKSMIIQYEDKNWYLDDFKINGYHKFIDCKLENYEKNLPIFYFKVGSNLNGTTWKNN